MSKIFNYMTWFYYRSAFAEVFSIHVPRIIEYPKLERTYKDLRVQIMALHRMATRIPECA